MPSWCLRHLCALSATLVITGCGAATTTTPSVAHTTAAGTTSAPRPSPELPAVSTQHVVASFHVGSPFAVGAGWIWAARDLHGAQGAGSTPGLLRYDPATGRQDPATVDLAENPVALAVSGGVVRVLTPHEVALVDAPTMRVIARVDTSGNATALAVGTDADWVGDGGALLRLDQRRHAVTATVRITSITSAAAQGEPSQVAVSGGFVWATMDAEQKLARIDPASSVVGATVGLPFTGVNTMVAAADGGVWIDFFDDGRVAHVDTAGHVQVLPTQVPQPTGFAVVGGDLWAASHRVGELWRIDEASGSLLERIRIGAPAGEVIADGTAVWAWGGGYLTRVDAS